MFKKAFSGIYQSSEKITTAHGHDTDVHAQYPGLVLVALAVLVLLSIYIIFKVTAFSLQWLKFIVSVLVLININPYIIQYVAQNGRVLTNVLSWVNTSIPLWPH